MIPYPEIDPIVVQIGPIAVRWYGLMYLLGFAAAYLLISYLVKLRNIDLDKEGVADFLTYAVLGVILGGRFGYVLFYNLSYYIENPLDSFAVWKGGMSFHGGFIGVIVASLIFCRRRGIDPLAFGDVAATAATIGLGFGRIGNFINGELWGRVTTVPWGMIFPGAGLQPRHPSQLYQAFLEGGVLFVILLFLIRAKVKRGIPLWSFFIGYGVLRFFVEFVREPDAHLQLTANIFSRGQLLSFPMILIGVVGVYICAKSKSGRIEKDA